MHIKPQNKPMKLLCYSLARRGKTGFKGLDMKEYWYLREGDFLPEKIETLCDNWKRSRKTIIEFLSQNGNIFQSRKSADMASQVVRNALIAHQAQTGHLSEIHIDVDNPECVGY